MKKYKHSYNYGKRITNPYTILFSAMIISLWLMGESNHYDDVYVREAEPVMKPVVMEVIYECGENLEYACSTTRGKLGKWLDSHTEDKIKQHFPRSHKTMIAIAKAESHMNPNAVGYNCYYYKGKATTTPIKGGSKACEVEDRHLAWSYDCGLLQLHNGKKKCPKETIDEHLERAANLSRKQGLDAWVTYWNGAHKKHLAQN